MAWPNCPDISIILKLLAGFIHLMWGNKLRLLNMTKTRYSVTNKQNLNREKKTTVTGAFFTPFFRHKYVRFFILNAFSLPFSAFSDFNTGKGRSFGVQSELWRLNILSVIFMRVMTLLIKRKESMYLEVCTGKAHLNTFPPVWGSRCVPDVFRQNHK